VGLLTRLGFRFRTRPERSFRVAVGKDIWKTISLVLYRGRAGAHHWEWSFDRFKFANDAARERLERTMIQGLITRAEKRLGLPYTYPPDHWSHRVPVPDWLWGWPWDPSIPAESAEEELER
jgi:hypothetical protein